MTLTALQTHLEPTITDIKQAKRKAEMRIREILDDLQESTGMSVKRIDCDERHLNLRSTEIAVKIHLEL